MLLLIMRIPKHYCIRERVDCKRYEVIIYDPKGFGRLYGGLFATRELAEESIVKDWGLKVVEYH